MNQMIQEKPASQRAQRTRSELWVIVCLLGVFLFGLPALFALPAEAVLFNPDVYKAQLEQMGLYERYPQILGATLAEGSDMLLAGAGENLLEVLQRGNYPEFVRLLFPEEWVRSQAESLIDQFFANLNFETPRLALVVDFAPVIERLESEEGLALVQTLVTGLPVCTGEDMALIGLLILQGRFDEAPLCRPPDQLAAVMNEVVTAGLRGAASLAPGQVDLAGVLRLPAFLAGQSSAAGLPSQAFEIYRWVRTLSPWLGVVSLGFLAAAVWLARSTARGPVFWAGAALALPGFAALMITMLLALVGNQAAPLLLGNLFFADMLLFDLLVRLFQAVFNQYLLWVGGIGLALALVGVVMIGMGLGGVMSRKVDK